MTAVDVRARRLDAVRGAEEEGRHLEAVRFFQQVGDTTARRLYATRAVHAGPDDWQAWNALALAWLADPAVRRSTAAEGAITAGRQAARRAPDLPEPHETLVDALFAGGRRAEADTVAGCARQLRAAGPPPPPEPRPVAYPWRVLARVLRIAFWPVVLLLCCGGRLFASALPGNGLAAFAVIAGLLVLVGPLPPVIEMLAQGRRPGDRGRVRRELRDLEKLPLPGPASSG